jgi:hypothetical protein
MRPPVPRQQPLSVEKLSQLFLSNWALGSRWDSDRNLPRTQATFNHCVGSDTVCASCTRQSAEDPRSGERSYTKSGKRYHYHCVRQGDSKFHRAYNVSWLRQQAAFARFLGSQLVPRIRGGESEGDELPGMRIPDTSRHARW